MYLLVVKRVLQYKRFRSAKMWRCANDFLARNDAPLCCQLGQDCCGLHYLPASHPPARPDLARIQNRFYLAHVQYEVCPKQATTSRIACQVLFNAWGSLLSALLYSDKHTCSLASVSPPVVLSAFLAFLMPPRSYLAFRRTSFLPIVSVVALLCPVQSSCVLSNLNSLSLSISSFIPTLYLCSLIPVSFCFCGLDWTGLD